MNRTGRRYQRLATAAVVSLFAAFWLTEYIIGEPPEAGVIATMVMIGVVALPWVIAIRIVIGASWRRTVATIPDADGPEWLLSAATLALPSERQEWGRAMSIELVEVVGQPARWRFALGAARTALFPPRGLSAAGRRAGSVLTVSITVAVIGCIAIAVYFLAEHPNAGELLTVKGLAAMAVVLGFGLWIVLATPLLLTPSRSTRVVVLITGLILATGYLATARYSGTDAGVWVVFGPMIVLFLAATLGAMWERSTGAGLRVAVWGALLGTLLMFLVGVPEAIEHYQIDQTLFFDGEGGYPIGMILADAIWVLVAVPLLGLPFGVFGAALGGRLASRRVTAVTLVDAVG